MPRLTHISFDLDHTLFDFDQTLNEALQAVAQLLTQRTGTEITATALQDTRNALASTAAGQSAKLLDLRRWSFEHVLNGQPDKMQLVEQAMQQFEFVRFGRIHLYPEAAGVLEDLSKTFKLAAVTNGNTDPERSALAGMFETVVFAEDCSYRKPDVRIFQLLMRQLNIENPQAILHVGDSLTDDVQGANAAGFATVWFNANHAPNPTGIRPTYEIDDLLDLPKIADIHRSSLGD